MLTTNKAKGLAIALAATALVGAVATVGNNASADPKQYDQQIIGVGSDTTQSIMNAMAGYENGHWYNEVHGTSNNRTIVSWDATAAGLTTSCIVTKTGGPAFNRPFGSGAGRTALQSTLVVAGDITTPATTSNSNCGAGQVNVSGNLSFARSSSASTTAAKSGTTGPNGTGGNLALENLAYVPFALDALSYGAYRASGGAPVTDLTTNELTQIFTTAGGIDVVRPSGNVRVIGCGIQASSGTGTSWLGKIGAATGTNTATCDSLVNPGTLAAFGPAEENNGDDLVARGTAAAAGTQVVIGFSVGNFIGKANGVSAGGEPAGVVMGSIVSGTTITLPAGASGASPTLGTAPSLSPNPAYFDSTSTFTRLLYNVFPDNVINSANANAFPDLKQIFKGKAGGATTTQPDNQNPAALCAQTATIQLFGFLTTPLCGDTSKVQGG
jgi:hypothetical protein